ncbi:hypothetical protein PHYPSEUDO_015430 [Phytophthora pseudosyringae]|uniref:Uncharacterized protein n=1 Tax=Phytophthora pseudosyringae TaxID=221518 RepID=A0A8T1W0B5_9STRA|nr:hypothetical protein PHYPSEUDO_015430 [Phytophthora pseudosyringae]
MGGGNGQKSAAKRDRNNAKKMKEAKHKNHAESKAKMEADRNGLKCKICLATFLITASVRQSPGHGQDNRYQYGTDFCFCRALSFRANKNAQLNDHYQSKHMNKGFTLEQCFPGHA